MLQRAVEAWPAPGGGFGSPCIPGDPRGAWLGEHLPVCYQPCLEGPSSCALTVVSLCWRVRLAIKRTLTVVTISQCGAAPGLLISLGPGHCLGPTQFLQVTVEQLEPQHTWLVLRLLLPRAIQARFSGRSDEAGLFLVPQGSQSPRFLLPFPVALSESPCWRRER